METRKYKTLNDTLDLIIERANENIEDNEKEDLVNPEKRGRILWYFTTVLMIYFFVSVISRADFEYNIHL